MRDRGTLIGPGARIPLILRVAAAAWLGVAAGCGGSSGPATATAPAATPAGPRPNFVVILADDMAADLFGANRRYSFLDLPNLERLAAGGVQFERAFVTTSLCSPSRATLLSGLYAHSHGVLINDANDLSASVATYPRLLQREGYKTAFIGKWHMDPTKDGPRPGFDYWLSFRGQGVYENQLMNENGRPLQTSGYITDVLTSYALAWLRQRGPEPFLMILSHKAPHGPNDPAARHLAALSEAKLPEPPSFRDTFKDKPAWQRRYAECGGTQRAFTECPDPLPAQLPLWGWDAQNAGRLNYLRSLLALDDSVGSVVSELASEGVSQSTYVVFLSDNGYFLGEHRLADKRLGYEESLRVPFVVSGGGLGPRRLRGMVLNLDLAETLLELAGVTVPGTMQGRSLVRMLHGETQSVRDSFLYEYFPESLIPVVPKMYGVRTEARKYLTYPASSEEELYDLATDPAEITNVAARPEFAAVRLQLQQQLNALLDQTGGR